MSELKRRAMGSYTAGLEWAHGPTFFFLQKRRKEKCLCHVEKMEWQRKLETKAEGSRQKENKTALISNIKTCLIFSLKISAFFPFYTSKYKFVDRDWKQYKFELPEQSIV